MFFKRRGSKNQQPISLAQTRSLFVDSDRVPIQEALAEADALDFGLPAMPTAASAAAERETMPRPGSLMSPDELMSRPDAPETADGQKPAGPPATFWLADSEPEHSLPGPNDLAEAAPPEEDREAFEGFLQSLLDKPQASRAEPEDQPSADDDSARLFPDPEPQPDWTPPETGLANLVDRAETPTPERTTFTEPDAHAVVDIETEMDALLDALVPPTGSEPPPDVPMTLDAPEETPPESLIAEAFPGLDLGIEPVFEAEALPGFEAETGSPNEDPAETWPDLDALEVVPETEDEPGTDAMTEVAEAPPEPALETGFEPEPELGAPMSTSPPPAPAKAASRSLNLSPMGDLGGITRVANAPSITGSRHTIGLFHDVSQPLTRPEPAPIRAAPKAPPQSDPEQESHQQLAEPAPEFAPPDTEQMPEPLAEPFDATADEASTLDLLDFDTLDFDLDLTGLSPENSEPEIPENEASPEFRHVAPEDKPAEDSPETLVSDTPESWMTPPAMEEQDTPTEAAPMDEADALLAWNTPSPEEEALAALMTPEPETSGPEEDTMAEDDLLALLDAQASPQTPAELPQQLFAPTEPKASVIQPDALDLAEITLPPLELNLPETPQGSDQQLNPFDEMMLDQLGDELKILASTVLMDDFRILYVHYEATYALMVDNGENAMKIRIFDGNLLAHNPTFKVAQQARIGNKAMFVVQIGDWQGIISLESDEPKLQAELTP